MIVEARPVCACMIAACRAEAACTAAVFIVGRTGG